LRIEDGRAACRQGERCRQPHASRGECANRKPPNAPSAKQTWRAWLIGRVRDPYSVHANLALAFEGRHGRGTTPSVNGATWTAPRPCQESIVGIHTDNGGAPLAAKRRTNIGVSWTDDASLFCWRHFRRGR
jgi:hypothetical protein